MSGVSEKGILSQEEFDDYRAKTSRYRFMNQLLLGVGGATVFGLVGAVGRALFDFAVFTTPVAGAAAAPVFAGLTAVGLAWAGLAALAVVGLGCVYAGSRYLTRNIIIDQDFQAKKISAAANGRYTKEVGASPVQPVPPAVLPPGMGPDQQREVNQDGPKWAERTAATRPIVAELSRADADKTWAERALTAKEEAPQLTAVRA